MICGHKEGVISFWSLKKSPEMDKNSFKPSESEYSNILKGVFSHRYDKSIYINKSVPLDTLVPTQKVVMNQAFKTIDKQARISSLNLSSDQTILYIGLDNGELYYIRRRIEESLEKKCNQCGNQIGLVDTKLTCAVCQKVFCHNCLKNEVIIIIL